MGCVPPFCVPSCLCTPLHLPPLPIFSQPVRCCFVLVHLFCLLVCSLYGLLPIRMFFCSLLPVPFSSVLLPFPRFFLLFALLPLAPYSLSLCSLEDFSSLPMSFFSPLCPSSLLSQSPPPPRPLMFHFPHLPHSLHSRSFSSLSYPSACLCPAAYAVKPPVQLAPLFPSPCFCPAPLPLTLFYRLSSAPHCCISFLHLCLLLHPSVAALQSLVFSSPCLLR